MRKNGFTLIELLAVIVILAIIALIATPIILNIINDSKDEATLRSAENYLDAVTQSITRKNMNTEFNPSTCDVESDGNLSCDTGKLTIEVDGEKPTSGTITFNNGKVDTVTNLKYGDSYVSTGEDNKLVIGDKKIIYNTLTTGQTFNSKIKSLAAGSEIAYNTSDTLITTIEFLSNGSLPEGYTKETLTSLTGVDVSANYNGSIMAYYDGNGAIYVYSKDNILGNLDSSYMFSYLGELTSIDVNKLDTVNVTNMKAMFQGCTSLTILNLSNFDTRNVTTTYSMFSDCTGLTMLDLSGWDMTKLTSINLMFKNCTNLTELNLSEWIMSNGSKFTTAGLNTCTKLKTINFSDIDTTQMTDMSQMFIGCSNFETLDLSDWDTVNVTNMTAMFQDCTGLITLDLSGWDTSNVTSMAGMFVRCSNLENIELSDWNTSNVTSMTSMFMGCSSLTALDLSNFDTRNVTAAYSMFSGCTNLTCIQVGENWDKTKETTDMFTNTKISTTQTDACSVSS